METDESTIDVDQVVREFRQESIKLWTKSMNMPVSREGFWNLLLQAARAVYQAKYDGEEMTDCIDWNGDESAELHVFSVELSLKGRPLEDPDNNIWYSAMEGYIDEVYLLNVAHQVHNKLIAQIGRRSIAGSLRITEGKLVWLAEAL